MVDHFSIEGLPNNNVYSYTLRATPPIIEQDNGKIMVKTCLPENN